ncbi:MAG: VOC family protein [Pseudonocardiales bacterium]|nr:VOC family protein [Pseudonocardiales bacterium]
MEITAELDAIGIVVTDLRATLDFYRLVGLPVPDGAEDAPHVEVPLAGGMRLMFDPESTVRSFDPTFTPPPPGGGRVGLAVRLSGPAAVDALYERITAAGHHGELAPFDAPWGQRYATVLDPDGTGVDLYAPLPG